MNTRPVEELVRNWAERYNQGKGWVEEICSPEFLWIEKPSQAFPKGRVGNYDFLMTAVNANLARNPDRKITVARAAACAANEAAVEWTWTGLSPAGGSMSFQAMSFLKFENDKLVCEIDYLCFWEVEKAEDFFNPDGTWRVESAQ